MKEKKKRPYEIKDYAMQNQVPRCNWMASNFMAGEEVKKQTRVSLITCVSVEVSVWRK